MPIICEIENKTLPAGSSQEAQMRDSWKQTADSLLRSVHTLEDAPLSPTVSVPFFDALIPIVAFGIRRLKMITAVTHSSLERALWADLAGRVGNICELTLGEAFLQFRADYGELASLLRVPESNPSDRLYRRFVSSLRTGGWEQLFADYPVLLRLVALNLNFWLEERSELLTRLALDKEELAERLFQGASLGALVDIQGRLSDPHHRGRSVSILTFDCGAKLVYKPRSMTADAAWNGLVIWLHCRNENLDLKTCAVWDRTNYGWAEYIEPSECQSLEGARRFYWRAGMLTCLLYALKATDFHQENIIAHGEHPIPIDLETLFSHDAIGAEAGTISDEVRSNSVLRSSILPCWERFGETALDNNGFAIAADGICGRGLVWKSPGSDHMHLAVGDVPVKSSRNLPKLSAGEVVDPAKFIPELSGGFLETYRTLVTHQTEILASNGPLAPFRGLRVRWVYRPTDIYSRLRNRSLTPRLLRSEEERNAEFEGLRMDHAALHVEKSMNAMFLTEKSSLDRLDIPYFEAATDSDELMGEEGRQIPGLLAGPSFQAVTNHIVRFSEADCQRQLNLIRGSFEVRDMRPPEDTEQTVEEFVPSPVPPVAMAGYIEEAFRIAEIIKSECFSDNSGGAHWLCLAPLQGSSRYRLCFMKPSLYDGLAGVALFFGALFFVTRNRDAHRYALKTLQTIQGQMYVASKNLDLQKRAALADGIGGASGLGGVIYALAVLAGFLEEPKLLNQALDLSAFLEEDVLAETRHSDIIAGVAGSMLSLLKLNKISGNSEVLRKAGYCGSQLIQRQKQEGSWAIEGAPALTGFAHGAAGISFALSQLYTQMPQREFFGSAQHGVHFESRAFSSEKSNWADFRNWAPGEPMRYRVAWCHGAPGIGLGRLGSLGDGVLLDRDVEAAIRCVSPRASPIDNICCGEAGIADFLLEAGIRLDRPELISAAHERASRVVNSAKERRDSSSHGYLLGACTGSGRFSYGFFQGLSGIGYLLLRLAAPQLLPCVELWS